MKSIAIFYHAILDGGAVPINTDAALGIMFEQMAALKASGLSEAATEIIVGLNGSDAAALMVRAMVPEKARVVRHPDGNHSEIPTLTLLRYWLPGHEDWTVFYHHIKGVTHPGVPLYERWRRRMEQACVWGWRECVADLKRGTEAVGCHWLTPEQYPALVKTPMFGGTFWWATAQYLMTLPPLPEPTWANRYEAESWIGRGPRRPVVRDYHPGWPG
jgi:hypothetical protein